jgi:nitrite reductase (NO-forming)
MFIILEKKRSYMICRTFLLVISIFAVSSQLLYAAKNGHAHKDIKQGFGPGDNYAHQMSVNLADYPKISDISKRAYDLPVPLTRNAGSVDINLEAKEVVSEIARGISYHYWTFNNTVPGPMLRVKKGDTVKLSLHNASENSHSHSIDLHAVTGPGGGAGVTEAKPGETKVLMFKAKHSGLYVYHCASGNASTHIANGMYGLILVEPKRGLIKVDKEFYIMQGELYTHGGMGDTGFQSFAAEKMIDERPEYIVFNGRTGALTKQGALRADVGDKVRIFIGNAGVAKISSFHIIGEIFDRVFSEATTSYPQSNVQTTLVPAGGASMIEFTIDYPGNYVLVDHALTRIDRGAWGVLKVTGRKNKNLFR